MSEGQWYYTQQGQQVGPISFYQLQQMANTGTLQPSDYVWTEGQGDWKPASQIAGLFSGSSSGSFTPPPPGAPSPGSPMGPDIVMPTDPPRDPTLMAILSLVVPGLGQIVLGQTAKGAAILVVFFGLNLMACCGVIFALLGAIAVAVASIIDAHQIAVKLRSGQPVGQWEFF
jgi:TM2 domain-containing membrane protein YozV